MSRPPASPLPVVLDTNVVLDVLVFQDALTRPLADALAAGALIPWADGDTLTELERVLTFRFPRLEEAARRSVLAQYQGWVRLVPEGALAELSELPRCRDRSDQKFLRLAARAGAAWLVSKDKQVLSMAGRHGLPFEILTPRQATARLPPCAAAPGLD